MGTVPLPSNTHVLVERARVGEWAARKGAWSGFPLSTNSVPSVGLGPGERSGQSRLHASPMWKHFFLPVNYRGLPRFHA